MKVSSFAAAVFHILVTNMLLFSRGAQSKLITCICTTNECHIQNINRCNTTHMCYSQYLDRGDGSNPVTKGCIDSKTPLLCENRRPAVSDGMWPVLKCCSTNLCNQDTVLPQMKTQNKSVIAIVNATKDFRLDSVNATPASHSNGLLSNKMSVTSNGINSSSSSSNTVSTPPQQRTHVINPIYIGVLVIGICSLVVIGIVAMMVLRRPDRLCDTEYATIERNGYFKAHQSNRCAVEDPPDLQLPRTTNGVYDNKITVNT